MAYRICCLVMPPNRKSKLRAFLRVDQVLHRRKMAYIAILVSGLQSEWRVLTTTVLMSGFYIILFFFLKFLYTSSKVIISIIQSDTITVSLHQPGCEG